jgi:DNA-binding transcriptional regulator GbsR (MarR family)
MELIDAKNRFIQTWGSLGTQWGINKTMGQIYALLFVSEKPLSMEDIMEELKISRGNASMNIRGLIDWGIVFKDLVPGERKEFYSAEKNMDELISTIARERSKREIKPALKALKEVSTKTINKTKEEKYFTKQTKTLYSYLSKADNVLEKVTEHRDNWFSKLVIKMLK